jgi:hypothetical protein
MLTSADIILAQLAYSFSNIIVIYIGSN